MEPFRLRLKFDDSVLSDSQKSDGLQRSWILVQPGHHTIADLVSYLLHAFDLWDSCPHGIFLSVKGFALPHFDSIAILHNNDLVCVERKGSKLLVEENVKRKLPCVMGMPLSANEDFGKEAGGYQSETEEENEGDVQTDSLDEDKFRGYVVGMEAQTIKKGKKWGKEEQSANTCGGNTSTGEWKSGSKRNDYTTRGRSCAARKAPQTDALKDYEKLVPLTDFPLVGKVSLSDPKSNRVGPKWAETSTWAPASGWGTLAQPGNEIGMNAALASTSGNEKCCNLHQSWTFSAENGNKDVCEELSAAVSAKKAELLKEDTWNKKRKPANYTWSYRTPRNRALGPNSSSLRAQNGGGVA